MGKVFDILRRSGYAVAVSPLHDKDIRDFETGELAKPHYHIIVRFPTPRYLEPVRRLVGSWIYDADGLATAPDGEDVTWYVRPVPDYPGAIRYLCHIDTPEKHRYPENEVLTFGFIDISALYAKSLSDDMQGYYQLIAWCRNNPNKTYSQLVDAVYDSDDKGLMRTLTRYSYTIKAYLADKKGASQRIARLILLAGYSGFQGVGFLHISNTFRSFSVFTYQYSKCTLIKIHWFRVGLGFLHTHWFIGDWLVRKMQVKFPVCSVIGVERFTSKKGTACGVLRWYELMEGKVYRTMVFGDDVQLLNGVEWHAVLCHAVRATQPPRRYVRGLPRWCWLPRCAVMRSDMPWVRRWPWRSARAGRRGWRMPQELDNAPVLERLDTIEGYEASSESLAYDMSQDVDQMRQDLTEVGDTQRQQLEEASRA